MQKIKVTLRSMLVNYLKLKALLATKRCSKPTLCDMKDCILPSHWHVLFVVSF